MAAPLVWAKLLTVFDLFRFFGVMQIVVWRMLKARQSDCTCGLDGRRLTFAMIAGIGRLLRPARNLCDRVRASFDRPGHRGREARLDSSCHQHAYSSGTWVGVHQLRLSAEGDCLEGPVRCLLTRQESLQLAQL